VADEAFPDLPEEARRELANRRRDLEREFDAKLRDLKAQHQRRHDALKREQAEWDARRREQAKALADRTETVRRRSDNAQQKADLAAAERQELAALRQDVKELEQAQREARRVQARLQEEAGAARRLLRSAQVRSRWAAALLAAGALAWLAAGRGTPLGLAFLAAGLGAAFLLALGVKGRSATGPGGR
jgi:seryl-tRNA synthetase